MHRDKAGSIIVVVVISDSDTIKGVILLIEVLRCWFG